MPAKTIQQEDTAQVSASRRSRLREQVAGTMKVIMLTGGLLGGLWLLQIIAKN